ncbi:helix-turn-helix domain-containing protein [Mesorhizobium sp. M0991]|uniref:helix-turn-helix transcriptional regulator n=1 Tax=Mesorhizobium sp. M0991 TaxID=2957043 RepID=UPI00333C1CA2
MPDASPVYLCQEEVARRFRVSPRTLERWRWKKTGPNYHKLGGRIVYSLNDIETYERRRRAETHSSIIGSWG